MLPIFNRLFTQNNLIMWRKTMNALRTKYSPLALALAIASQGAIAEGGIEQVVVTAQKREQTLQETPIAISALSTAAIEERNIHDIAALNGMVPNLRLASSPGNANGATINIRGSVTINPALTMEPTVGLYLDGIYIGKNVGGVFDIADLERVEVLRGPQGTLYGKNTLGGAINLITKKPSGEFGGEIKASVGNYDYSSVRATLDTPSIGTIGEGIGKLSAKLAFIASNRAGFVDNVQSAQPGALAPSGQDFGNLHSHAGRAALRWQPTDAIEALYSYDFSRSDQRPRFYQLTRVDQPTVGFLAGLAGFPGTDLTGFTSTHRQSKGSEDAGRDDNAYVDGHGLVISWDAGTLGVLGDVTFKSLTGHRQIRANDDLDWDGSPYPLMETIRKIGYHATSQEFQMVGKTERVNYVAGLYYFKESGHTDNPLFLTLFGLPAINSFYGLDNKAYAAFAQADYTPPILDDRLTVTVGARVTKEKKEITRSYIFGGSAVISDMKFNKDYSNTSPTIIANYRITDDINVYGKIARGWKAGVFNAESSDIAELNNPIKPEVVTSYEIGMKSRWLDNRVNANIAYFYDFHKDMQISRFDQASAQSAFTNAGKADIQGIELELVAQPTDALQISVAYGWLDATYKKYEDTCRLTPTGANPCPTGVAPGATFDAKNVNKFPYTPKNTANVAVQYTQPLPIGELIARVDWSYSDDFAIYPDPFNDENTSIDSYQLVDARLTWGKVKLANNELAVSAWVKNLTDEKYRVNGIEWGPYTMMNYGDPRTYGMDVSLKF
jgi:iron complex outermembrane receptor protein